MCVVFVSGCLAGWAYVSMGLMYYLYTRMIASLDWPNVVLASARRPLKWVFAVVFMFLMCGLKVFFFVLFHSERGGRVRVRYLELSDTFLLNATLCVLKILLTLKLTLGLHAVDLYFIF